jgi:hypothetical protein
MNETAAGDYNRTYAAVAGALRNELSAYAADARAHGLPPDALTVEELAAMMRIELNKYHGGWDSGAEGDQRGPGRPIAQGAIAFEPMPFKIGDHVCVWADGLVQEGQIILRTRMRFPGRPPERSHEYFVEFLPETRPIAGEWYPRIAIVLKPP